MPWIKMPPSIIKMPKETSKPFVGKMIYQRSMPPSIIKEVCLGFLFSIDIMILFTIIARNVLPEERNYLVSLRGKERALALPIKVKRCGSFSFSFFLLLCLLFF